MKLIVFLDKSTSMNDELEVFADLVDSMTEKLEQRCSEFSIAISEIQYKDKSNPMGIVGYPAFVTEDHPNPNQALRERILSNLPTQDCSGSAGCYPVAAAHVGNVEYTYSSIVSTFQINKNQIFNEPISQLSTLIITDASAEAEPYSIDEALHHISTFIPLNQFSATSISNRNFENPTNEFCPMDIVNSPADYMGWNYQNLEHFVHQAGGMSLDICNNRTNTTRQNLEQQINDFINEAILQGCQLYS